MSSYDLRVIWSHVDSLREDLGRAEVRIGELEERLHDHEQPPPAVSDG